MEIQQDFTLFESDFQINLISRFCQSAIETMIKTVSLKFRIPHNNREVKILNQKIKKDTALRRVLKSK